MNRICCMVASQSSTPPEIPADFEALILTHQSQSLQKFSWFLRCQSTSEMTSYTTPLKSRSFSHYNKPCHQRRPVKGHHYQKKRAKEHACHCDHHPYVRVVFQKGLLGCFISHLLTSCGMLSKGPCFLARGFLCPAAS